MRRPVRPVELLARTYADLHAVLDGLSGDDEWTPTGCAGWCVRDLVQHLLGDPRRALIALGTPAGSPPDTDAVSYWRAWSPGTGDAADERRLTRVVSSVWPSLAPLTAAYVEASDSAVHLLRLADPDEPVQTQGHVIGVADLTRTLVFEAAVHHLDLVAHLDAPGPAPDALGLVRETLDGLLGGCEPVGWDDVTYALAATGRRSLTPAERSLLGSRGDRFPLTG